MISYSYDILGFSGTGPRLRTMAGCFRLRAGFFVLRGELTISVRMFVQEVLYYGYCVNQNVELAV